MAINDEALLIVLNETPRLFSGIERFRLSAKRRDHIAILVVVVLLIASLLQGIRDDDECEIKLASRKQRSCRPLPNCYVVEIRFETLPNYWR